MEIQHNGVTYKHLNIKDEKVAGHVNLGDNKAIFDGNFSITLTKGSYKYGDEIQFNVYHKKGNGKIVKKSRNKSDYNSVEIMLPSKYIKQIAEWLQFMEEKNERKPS